MLWLRVARGSVMGEVCPYYLPVEWDRIAAQAVPASVAPLLYDRLSDTESPMGPEQFEAFRAEIVAVLGAMLLRATRPMPPRRVPQDPVTHRVRPPHHAAIDHFTDLIKHDLSRRVSLTQFAQATRLTPDYIRLLFKRATGMRIQQYLLRHRMEEAMRLCRETPMLVKEIARRVGYQDALYFSRVFHRYHRRWPTEVKRG
jgi:AraC-like DNA-binding protein